jgi:hypothetical protein
MSKVEQVCKDFCQPGALASADLVLTACMVLDGAVRRDFYAELSPRPQEEQALADINRLLAGARGEMQHESSPVGRLGGSSVTLENQ